MRILKFLKHLTINNPVKMFITVLLFIFTGLAVHFNYEVVDSDKVITSFTDNGKWHYVCPNGTDYTVKNFDKELEIKDNKISYISTCAGFYVFTILSCILGFVILIMAIIGDRETEWDFSGNWHESGIDYVYCEFEDGIYYYVYNGRLIHKDQNQLDRWYFKTFIENYSRNRNLYPEFISKTQKRDKKLKELFND